MIKKFKLIINTILYHPLIFFSLIFEMLFVIFFSLNSINYISKELSVVNFTSRFSNTNFICYMPFSSSMYDNAYTSNGILFQENLQEERLKTYSLLTGLKSYSKSCTFSAENSYGNFEVRAISDNVYENINISLKKGSLLNKQEKNSDYVNCIVSDGSLSIGDIITVSLNSEGDNNESLTLRVSGIMNPPYFNFHPSTIGVEQGFADIFIFTSQEELSAFNYSIIWVDYNDILDYINDNKLDKDKDSPIYAQLLFFDNNLTESQMQRNKKILEKNGYVFDYETSADFNRIKEYVDSQLPPLICIVIVSIIGFAVMIYLNVFLLRSELIIFRTCGATEKEIYVILNSMYFLAMILVNFIIALMLPLLTLFEIIDIDVSFVKYNNMFIILLNSIFIIISLLVSGWCQKKQTKIKDEFND